jgi:hypothetical protein
MESAGKRLAPVVWVMAFAFGALQLGTARLGEYDFFHDEFYYWIGGQRLMWGYVDHPPLAAWSMALTTGLFGDGLLGFRSVSTLCGMATVVLTARMAARLGAAPFAQAMAAACVIFAPFTLIFFSFHSVNAIELLAWTLACSLLVDIIANRDPRYWWAFGLVAGLALLNKHTFALLGAALSLGLLATPQRVLLWNRAAWGGAVLALLIASPNLLWNAVNDWPSLGFYMSRAEVGNLPTSVGDALFLQVAGTNPIAAAVWIPGVWFLCFSKAGRRYRGLGIAFALLFVVIVLSGQRRGDRIAGAYPVVFAAGAAAWDLWRFRGRTVLRGIVATALVGVGVLLLPPSLPITSLENVAAWFDAVDESPTIEATDVGEKVPLTLSGRVGWQAFAEHVIAQWRALPPEQRSRAAIVTSHWVFASVIEYYGRDVDLPPVVSPHNAYAFWNDRIEGRDVVVSVDVRREALDRAFADTRALQRYTCAACPAFRPELEIHVSSRPLEPLAVWLEAHRHYGLTPVPEWASWLPEPDAIEPGADEPGAD